MKKIMIVLLTIIALGSCSKNTAKNCKCGIVTDDDIEFDSNFNTYFTLTIKNDCSGNSQKFYMTQSAWMDSPVGETTCIDRIW
jgi:hypothetical protein